MSSFYIGVSIYIDNNINSLLFKDKVEKINKNSIGVTQLNNKPGCKKAGL